MIRQEFLEGHTCVSIKNQLERERVEAGNQLRDNIIKERDKITPVAVMVRRVGGGEGILRRQNQLNCTYITSLVIYISPILTLGGTNDHENTVAQR